jgi:hypothetical protein
MPLIVKPNLRRMRAFQDSPSERGYVRRPGAILAAPVQKRLLLAIGSIAIVVLLVSFLA